MKSFMAFFMTDFQVQRRNHLYLISAVVSIFLAVAMALLAKPNQLSIVSAAALILIGGGSTLLYVGAMIIFERDEGTLRAFAVSPAGVVDYLGAKLASLGLICAFETAIMIGGALLLMTVFANPPWPNLLPLLFATIATACIYTFTGIILVLRFKTLTDFLVPVSFIGTLLQLPFFYFADIFTHPFLLIIPTAAPAMLSFAAWRELALWEWGYAIGYTLFILAGLAFWVRTAFEKYALAGRAL